VQPCLSVRDYSLGVNVRCQRLASRHFPPRQLKHVHNLTLRTSDACRWVDYRRNANSARSRGSSNWRGQALYQTRLPVLGPRDYEGKRMMGPPPPCHTLAHTSCMTMPSTAQKCVLCECNFFLRAHQNHPHERLHMLR
jgi:hypothetical protein